MKILCKVLTTIGIIILAIFLLRISWAIAGVFFQFLIWGAVVALIVLGIKYLYQRLKQ